MRDREDEVRQQLEELEDSVVLPLQLAGSEDARAFVQAAIGEPRGTAESAICASLKREERLQYRFVVLYQTLVAVLAFAALLLLLVAVWRVGTGGSDAAIGALLSGAGAVVTGVAAVWLVRQRRDARTAHKAAQAGLAKHKCKE